MKTIRIKSLSLTNFRGHKSTVVDFSDLTTISGDNGTGKSTVFDAFIWLLFGKDQFDRKDHEIFPIENGVQMVKIDSVVSAVVSVDERVFELSRTLHQNWVRPRGQAEEVYKGNETLYTWAGVPVKAGEFKSRVDDIVDETVFKLLTNPSTFLSLNWVKLREFLFQMAGWISDEAIAESNPDFKALLEMVGGKKLAEFKTEIRARKKKAKTELDDIQPRIDQTTRLMPEAKDFAAIEKEIEGIDNEIIAIDGQIQDRSKAVNAQFEATQQKRKEINDLKTKQLQVVNEKTQQNRQDAFEKNQMRTNLENEFKKAKASAKSSEEDVQTAYNGVDTVRKRADALNSTLTEIRERWEAENAKEYKAKDGCLLCPIFGHECSDSTAASKHVEAQEKAKAAFFKEQSEKLDKIEEEGVSCSEEIKKLEERIKAGVLMREEAKKKADEFNSLAIDLMQKLSNVLVAEPQPVIPEDIPEWQKLENEIKAIEATIDDVQPVDNSELIAKKAELNKKRDELKSDLSDRETIANHMKEIKSLNARGSELAQQIADLEKLEFTTDAFNKVKIEECDRRINSMFSLVNFKLFDKTFDGNEFEICTPTNKNGVRWDATNTAEQINMGLDVINTLSRFYNVKVPIFVDRCESINEPIQAGSQMILIKVTEKGTKFSIN